MSGPEDGLEEDMFLCGQCTKTLQHPVMGPQLVRGKLTVTLRGTGRDQDVKKNIDRFMGLLKGLRQRN